MTPPPGLDQLKSTLAAARAEVAKVIIGQPHATDLALIAILAGSHALVEGVPGIAKTLLVKTLAHVLGADFARIQFTPDLMPSDITGTSIFDPRTGAFTPVLGPIFTGFLLADEINRAPAKTQSALLQAMQERTVTLDRQTYRLPPAFAVFATQNPIEYEGTYPLPEAQKDRFMLKIRMEPPLRDDEIALARRMASGDTPELTLDRGAVQPLLTADTLAALRPALNTVLIKEELLAYLVDLVRATRTHESVLSGAGPRATQSLLAASRAHAALQGRDYVTPDDLRALALPVLEHRIILRPEYEIEGLTPAELITQLLRTLTVPQ